MNKFITFRETKNGHLQYYVLQRDYPHYIGYVSGTPVTNIFPPAPIAGYNLWIVFDGTLRGNVIPSHLEVTQEIPNVLHTMSVWYACDRILHNEKKYKRFKI